MTKNSFENQNKNFFINKKEIEKLFNEFVVRKVSKKSAEWKDFNNTVFKQKRWEYFKRKFYLNWRLSNDKFNEFVRENYQYVWKNSRPQQLLSFDSDQNLIEWDDNGYFANPFAALVRVHLYAIKQIIENIGFSSLLEVGAGHGINLVILSNIFPNKKISGLELTDSGIEFFNKLKKLKILPKEFTRFTPEKFKSQKAYKKVNIHQGTAKKLPFKDKSFDITVTRLALEQMEAIRSEALKEITRVTKKYCILIEPFKEFNDKGLRKYHVQGHNYFQAKISDLKKYNMKPVFMYQDWPHKITIKPILVVAKIVD